MRPSVFREYTWLENGTIYCAQLTETRTNEIKFFSEFTDAQNWILNQVMMAGGVSCEWIHERNRSVWRAQFPGQVGMIAKVKLNIPEIF